ncbi:MAG TPA: sulfatase-like hydrolase/transferase, partial [Papillibacter sp.]|nr:sulfatase-like hydrolase/transferase [Papillibacter sp.]
MQKSTAYRLAGIFIMPLVCILLGQIITLQSTRDSFVWFFRNTAAAGFLYLFLLSCTAFLYGLTGRLWISSFVPGSLLLIITIISYFKTVINGTPLILNDLTLARRFKYVAQFAAGQLHLSFWLVAAILLFLGVHGFLFFRERKSKKARRLKIACLTAGALYFFLFFFTPLFSGMALKIANPEASQEEQAASLGIAMSLYCAKLQGDNEADVYTEEDVELIQSQIKEETEAEASAEPPMTPTVIFLMSESFFDVTELPGVDFEEDPVANFHALEQTYTSGKFLSSTYCGGTAYVEMEVLTGLCGYLLKENDTLTSLPDSLYGRLPVITDVFKNYGYSTFFLHSYTNKLYNREVIYNEFGFDSVLFSDSF